MIGFVDLTFNSRSLIQYQLCIWKTSQRCLFLGEYSSIQSVIARILLSKSNQECFSNLYCPKIYLPDKGYRSFFNRYKMSSAFESCQQRENFNNGDAPRANNTMRSYESYCVRVHWVARGSCESEERASVCERSEVEIRKRIYDLDVVAILSLCNDHCRTAVFLIAGTAEDRGWLLATVPHDPTRRHLISRCSACRSVTPVAVDPRAASRGTVSKTIGDQITVTPPRCPPAAKSFYILERRSEVKLVSKWISVWSASRDRRGDEQYLYQRTLRMSTRRRDCVSEKEPARSDGERTGADTEETNQPTPSGGSLQLNCVCLVLNHNKVEYHLNHCDCFPCIDQLFGFAVGRFELSAQNPSNTVHCKLP
ncbi:hypothetical protein T10_11858 [Trichinella papuae]|uniref:Uncharacterized protein n=1 Tax=Trichinella papuae TaxID=268474 RepID=A0A0V1M218_9BILA|nr:hypothetical protein T10_11858 [Trichinella papuae]